MKEFTITVTSDKPSSFLDDIGRQGAGPIPRQTADPGKGNISSVTLSARLVDVEYTEVQALLEKMKEDAKKA
jgi:hypothetical protein